MLTRFLAALAFAFAVLTGSQALADPAAKPAITSTIQNQFEAFKQDDFERAFSYASPNIKRIFGSHQNFGAMVQRGYPMVHRPSDVRFLDLREENGAPTQKVQVRDAGGKTHLLEYQMIETEDGWQINGVRLLKNAGVAA